MFPRKQNAEELILFLSDKILFYKRGNYNVLNQITKEHKSNH